MQHHEILDCIPWEMDNEALARLSESIKKNGLRDPLTTFEGKLLDGRNRFRACMLAGVTPRYVEFSGDFDDAKEYVIDKMLRKEHTVNQLAMAGARLANMKRGGTGANQHRADSATAPSATSQADAAERVGVSRDSIKRAASILNSGDEELIKKVESNEISVRKGSEIVKERKEVERQRAASTFNKTNDNIEWAGWSWNPVTGCKHGCKYCYAHDIANRFNAGDFSPKFHPERLEAPDNTKPDTTTPGGDKVFVCSMSDLFGPWVPQSWIDAVLNKVRANPQWTFIFLTKSPERLASITWPANAWVGTTVDTQARVKAAEAGMEKVKASVKFVSLEPLLEKVVFKKPQVFNWFIIGGQSRSSSCPEFQPEWEWVEGLVTAARTCGSMVYFKPNLTARPKEYPGK